MWRPLIHFPFNKVFDKPDCFVYTQYRYIDREIIGRSDSPLFIGVIIIVSGTRFVGFHHQFFCLLDSYILSFYNTLDTMFGSGMNKETQAVGIVTQNIVAQRPTKTHDCSAANLRIASL